MYHLYTILVRPKYDVSFVKAIHESFRKNISSSFVHTCLTDNIEQFENENFCNLIDISHHNLPTFWNKMLFFKKDEICKNNEKCIFFDLDSMILKDLTPMLHHVNDFLLVGQNPNKIIDIYLTKAMNSPEHGRHLTILNSSCMMWYGGQHHALWEKFDVNREDNMLYYYGNDEFITFEYQSNYKLIDRKWVFGAGSEKTAIYSNKIRY
jgi:hypothetical protein